jgi:shikimate kinase
VQKSRQIENITLIGFMGAGKTSVGHSLAALLEFRFVDTDDLVERKARKRIADIFQQDGEERFRQFEREVVATLAHCERTVIATGGGLPVNLENLLSLKVHSLVVWLWASPETIWQRVSHQSHRPLLRDPNPMEKIRRLLDEREPFYREADVLVSTELRSVRDVALHVAQQFRLSRPEMRHEGSHSNSSAPTGV